MRTFETGATRDSDEHKPDYCGYLSPLTLTRYGEYMMKHQVQADGEIRAADNWKKGIPADAYLESLFRHVLDAWLEHDGYESREGLQEALCAIIFNASGWLHEELKSQAELPIPEVDYEPMYSIIDEVNRRVANAVELRLGSLDIYADDTEEPISHHHCDGCRRVHARLSNTSHCTPCLIHGAEHDGVRINWEAAND